MTTAPAAAAEGCKLSGNVAARAEQRDVDAGEGIVGEFLHGDFLVAEGHLFAGGTRRSEQGQFGEREVPLFEAKEHFDADGTRGTYDRYMGMIHGMKNRRFSPGRGAYRDPPRWQLIRCRKHLASRDVVV